jgi:MFS family permease
MILEIGVVDDPENVGFYSGIIESIFAAMSLFAIMPCSALSDRYGRKPIIVFGTAGLAISISLFGMSQSFWFMIVTRCLGGTLAGSWSAMKIMIGEMTDKTNQATAFVGLSIFYRLGQVIGQPLGGFLAHPERNFPIFRSQFWYDYPFSLPCFVAAGVAIIAIILGSLFLEETLPSKQKKINASGSRYGAIEGSKLSPPPSKSVGIRKSDEIKRPPLRDVLTPQVVSLMISTAGMVFASETLFALYPLFAFTPIASGGLGLNEAEIGMHMAVRAIVNIAIMVLFGWLQPRMGMSTVRLYQLMMSMWPASVLFFPYLNYLARQGGSMVFFNFVLFICFVVWSFAGLAWTSIGVMANDASPSASALATINGISQMAISLPQALSPAFVTSLFAYSIESGIAGGNLIWIVLTMTCAVAAVHSLLLKEPSHDWRQEIEEVEWAE